MEANNNEFKKDNSIDINSLIQSKVKKEAPPKKNDELSPLEKAKLEEAKQGQGLVIDNEEMKKYEPKQFKTMINEDERMENMESKIDDFDYLLKKRSAIMPIRMPSNHEENREMMDEVDSVYFDENGKPVINYIDKWGREMKPKYIRLRTEIEPPYDKEGDFLLFKGVHPDVVKDFISRRDSGEKITIEDVLRREAEKIEEEKGELGDDYYDVDHNGIENASAEGIRKAKVVEILIDKTGCGINVNFTPEERAKLTEVNEIRVRKITNLDVNTVRAQRDDSLSFQEVIDKYTISNSQYRVFFPASGFSATMTGLTYGEFADISIDFEYITVENYRKRLTVIYNHMTNISCGQFESFEDFLRNFSHTDIPIAIYGLLVATQPDVQDIGLSCGNNRCKTEFNHKFLVRGLIQYDKCSDEFLNKMEELTLSDASKFDEIRKNADVNITEMYELPDSKIVFEMGISSAYHFLYNMVPLLDTDTFRSIFGENASLEDEENSTLLRSVVAVHVPDGNGGYVHATNFRDILKVIYMIKPNELKIIHKVHSILTDKYLVSFSIGKTQCPNCGATTNDFRVAIDDLVFRIFQQLTNTNIVVLNTQDS